mgnify:CR=1 FL=1
MNTTARFTASQIAAALGISKRSVLFRLKHTPPSGKVLVAGNPADAWTFEALPPRCQQRLVDEAKRRGYRDAEQLLTVPASEWHPPIPLAEVAPRFFNRAVQLQRALRPMQERMNDLTLSEGEFAALGVKHYSEAFGHPISTRRWWDLWKRTLDRDRGSELWDRLEIYLDTHLVKKPDPKELFAGVGFEGHEIYRLIASFKNPQQPTAEEQAMLWLYSFEYFERQIANGKSAKRERRKLLDFLFAKARFLADTMPALRKQFERKYARWVEGGRTPSSIADRRQEKSGRFRAPEITEQTRDRIIAKAVLECGGRVSQAWRDLRADGLDDQLDGYYLSNPASKSYVPSRVRDAVKDEVALLEDVHHGPRQHKLNGAHLSRDWTGVAAGDWHQSDDCTLPIYYYVPDGQGWFTLMRGQFLPMIDLRSTCILDYALQSERNYNARTIRTLITKVCDKYGLPRKGFYFEMGTWKTSRLLAGDPEATPFSFGEVELGLRELGLRFVHSKLPRSKPIERVLGAFQDMLEGDPGYVGRDEINDKFERVQKLKLEVERRKIHPAGHFYNAEEWFARLDELCARYNTTAQGGKMTLGKSPQEAFEQYQNPSDPPIKLDARCRYLLSHHKRPVKVTENGITLRFGKQAYTYRNEITGKLIGQMVLAWFNPEAPDVLVITDMNREKPVCLPLSYDVPAMDAPADILERELALIEEHQSYAKVRYSDLKRRFATPFRRNLVDAQTGDLGQAFQRAEEDAKATQRAAANRVNKVRNISGRLNMPMPHAAARSEEATRAAERLAELLQAGDLEPGDSHNQMEDS